MEHLRNVNLPPGNAVTRLAKVVLGGGAFIYAATHSLFNVEGGHRAIVFNRILGIKEKVINAGIGACSSIVLACQINLCLEQPITTSGVRGRHAFDGAMV